MAETRTPETVDGYIAAFPPEVQAVLEKIRRTVQAAAPEARERISYRIPTFTLDGVLVYFAAFKSTSASTRPCAGTRCWRRPSHASRGRKGI